MALGVGFHSSILESTRKACCHCWPVLQPRACKTSDVPWCVAFPFGLIHVAILDPVHISSKSRARLEKGVASDKARLQGDLIEVAEQAKCFCPAGAALKRMDERILGDNVGLQTPAKAGAGQDKMPFKPSKRSNYMHQCPRNKLNATLQYCPIFIPGFRFLFMLRYSANEYMQTSTCTQTNTYTRINTHTCRCIYIYIHMYMYL